MSNLDTSKKPAPQDWHRADIKAALEKRGLSLARLARLNGYGRTSTAAALHFPWPKMERLIAGAIGVAPQSIWPSRYHDDGAPKSGRGERGLGRYKAKHITGGDAVNVHKRRAA
ncbi:MAG: transcriptional regulator [Xanthobacteraceae bacterium]|nr:MAG: transcriptional regulator [Xanthobacteraceae bacterium]